MADARRNTGSGPLPLDAYPGDGRTTDSVERGAIER
jgi:hypothetical protein